jgi:putative membrane protein (TIGR04086 family)
LVFKVLTCFILEYLLFYDRSGVKIGKTAWQADLAAVSHRFLRRPNCYRSDYSTAFHPLQYAIHFIHDSGRTPLLGSITVCTVRQPVIFSLSGVYIYTKPNKFGGIPMENGIVKPLLRSLLISYVLSGLLLGALAFALFKLRLKEGQVNLMVYVVYLAACLTGGALAGRSLRQRRFFWGLLSGLFYFFVLFAVSWAMNPWSALDMERAVTVMGVCALGGMLGGMFSG